MKKIKLLIPMVCVTTISGVLMPLVSCRNDSKKETTFTIGDTEMIFSNEITLCINWQPNNHTIVFSNYSFKYNNGSISASSIEEVSTSDNATKKIKITFANDISQTIEDGELRFHYEDTTSATKGDIVKSNIYIQEIEPTQGLDVTIDLNGGTLNGRTGTVIKNVEYGAKYETLETPSKTDWTFEYWTLNGQQVLPSDRITSNVSIKASYSENDSEHCSVTINLNGGTLDGHTGTYTAKVSKGSAITSLGEPEKSGYEFQYWQSNDNKLSDSYTFSQAITIDAIWKKKAEPDPVPLIDVEIDLTGGNLTGWEWKEGTTGIKSIPSGSTYANLGEPIRENYYFAGWKNTETDDPIDLDDVINPDIKLSATWEAASIDKISAKFKRIYIDSSAIGYEDNGSSLDVYLYNDSQIPYIKLSDFFNSNYYGIEKQDTKTIITNKITSSTCTFDYENQKLIFSDYDKFLCLYPAYKNNPLAVGEAGSEDWRAERVDDYTSGGEYVIDLFKYNIFIFDDENNDGYMPYYFCKNIFDWDLTRGYSGDGSGCYMFAIDTFYEIWDDGQSQIQLPDPYGVTSVTFYLNALIKFEHELSIMDPIFGPAYREFAYNLLALTLDVRYGLTTRLSRYYPSTLIEYFPNGALEALAPYHNYFTTTEEEGYFDYSNAAMIEYAKMCDDGGHSWYGGNDVSAWDAWQPSEYTVGKEFLQSNNDYLTMYNARQEAHRTFTGDSDISIESSNGVDADDIAWVTFDEFNPYCYEDYDDINESNYKENGTFGMTAYLQKLVNASDSKIKYVVLDLSNNGGGAVATEHVLASYLCGRDNHCEPHSSSKGYGGVTHTIMNPHTHAFSKYTFYADINQDGSYNQDDYLPDDVELYCIVSGASFSCGNMLPCHLADCSNCKFIGSRSGGGACYVDYDIHIGLGNIMQISSFFHSLKNGSTKDNPITVDDGITPTFYPIPCDAQHAAAFYDRPNIIKWITKRI